MATCAAPGRADCLRLRLRLQLRKVVWRRVLLLILQLLQLLLLLLRQRALALVG